MASDVRTKIMEAISAGGEIPASTILVILLGVLDEIRAEIASMRGDLPGLREAVLNGHAHVHHDDHEHIGAERREDADARTHGEPTAAEIRTWARTRMADEVGDKASRRSIRDSIVQNVAWAMISSGATIFAIGALALLKGWV